MSTKEIKTDLRFHQNRGEHAPSKFSMLYQVQGLSVLHALRDFITFGQLVSIHLSGRPVHVFYNSCVQ